ncbi:hypothetical protein UP09_30405 [Bradyrhizobium sp. LTSP885]|uniref:tyrosine-type recombinase/integrase n=1 Tax=Bradyrhizobium sp. LTSP885 TaxID=1619232 RepID=UPI0005C85D1F|nr:tyrosine-type recombinase/integrase [Bradyrhizobium sp. LTSP885]KJC35554.1 hypothetical protein UP09_30405 [Bradyrhizobium sp. LTSP885]
MTASDAGKVDVQHLCKLAGVSRASYYRRFEARVPREADVELTSHIQLLSLRHACASLRIESGYNPKQIQRLMGHSSIKVTFDIYGHLFADAEGDQRAAESVQARLLG